MGLYTAEQLAQAELITVKMHELGTDAMVALDSDLREAGFGGTLIVLLEGENIEFKFLPVESHE